MLEVTPSLRVADEELNWTYVRSGGPGGQNVNKVASKAVLRWNLAASPGVSEEVKARFRAQQGRRLTREGDVVITSQRFRDQERNRQDCLDKLAEMLRLASIRPRTRRKTKPTRGSQEARLREKKRRSQTKAGRRGGGQD